VSVTVLFSSNNAGGADPDFLRRAGGAYPLIVQPFLCPNCHFAGWSESALEEPVDEKLKAALLSESPPFEVPEHEPIVPNGPLRGSFTENLDSKQVTPAWIRYDVLGQQLAFVGESPWMKFRVAQNAAWAVRLRENPFQEFLFDLSLEEVAEALKDVEDGDERQNAAAEQIKAARQLLGSDRLTKNQAVVAGFLLRSHGELTELEEALPRLIATIGEDFLTDRVKDSIALERRYLRKALEFTDELLADPPEEVQPGVLHYLRGEYYRRLGQPEAALAEYEKAAASPERPEWLEDWLKEQPKLVRK